MTPFSSRLSSRGVGGAGIGIELKVNGISPGEMEPNRIGAWVGTARAKLELAEAKSSESGDAEDDPDEPDELRMGKGSRSIEARSGNRHRGRVMHVWMPYG
jgi:hypothetical protein